MFFAHSTKDGTRDHWQRLDEHLNNVAKLAAACGLKFGVDKAAALAGAMHDLGKYTEAFQIRLTGAAERVDHSTAGAQEVCRLAVRQTDRHMAKLLAYAIAGHHAGLPDGEGETGALSDRLTREIAQPHEVWRDEVPVAASDLFPIDFRPHPNPSRRGFQFGFLGRMLFSCLVDADFRDTEAFYAKAERRAITREQSTLHGIIDELCAAFDAAMARKRQASPDGPVNRLRHEILTHVRAQAAARPGLFTLTVPTGGGKTLASLGFALDHARRHGLDRVIYAIPFTSVIDQTAAIFRQILGDDVVLEHHSAIDEETFRQRESADKLTLAMEDWAMPVVVTTNVQLFESLFSNLPSRCRKLHNLARSVIVLDEAQTIPLAVLQPCVAALDELARNYGTSIVLCTATQPALAAPAFNGGFAPEAVRELAPAPDRLSTELKRVTVRQAGEMTDGQLLDALAQTAQGLVIVNSRAHALQLYRQAVEAGLDGAVHLTTRQYAAHRRSILADVRVRLAEGRPCRLIATSLVEAGVDLDFPLVWRAEAGLDQIAQAAGRCNREGRWAAADSIVTVFKPAEFEPPRAIAQLAGDFARVAAQHEDLLSLDAIRAYFGEVYWRKGRALDTGRVLERFQADATGINFAYRTVAENFRLIESGLAPVIIARDDAAKRALARLASSDARAGGVARAVQPFIVQVPPKARALLLMNEHVKIEQERRFGDQFIVLHADNFYQNDTGLLWENAEYLGLETPII